MMIVKVQIPIVSNDPARPALVYAERHKNQVQQSLDAATVAQMGDDLKGYFEAEFKNGRWIIGKRVADRKW